MLGVLLIILVAGYVVFLFPIFKQKEAPVEQKYSTQMKKLWSIAQSSMKERKPLRAEKALLTILKFDEKNAAAYNRLGILYAKEQKFDEAIECFEIAQSLDSNASCLHNVGLIYLETGSYEKAEMAFLQALRMEDDVPARHIALAKAEEKLGKKKQAIASLEKAYKLEPTAATLRQLLAVHEAAGDTEATQATMARLEAQVAKDEKKRAEAMREKARKEAEAKAARTQAASRVARNRATARATRAAKVRAANRAAQAARRKNISRQVTQTQRQVAQTRKTKTVATPVRRTVTVKGGAARGMTMTAKRGTQSKVVNSTKRRRKII